MPISCAVLMRYFKSSGFPYHEEAAKKFVT